MAKQKVTVLFSESKSHRDGDENSSRVTNYFCEIVAVPVFDGHKIYLMSIKVNTSDNFYTSTNEYSDNILPARNAGKAVREGLRLWDEFLGTHLPDEE